MKAFIPLKTFRSKFRYFRIFIAALIILISVHTQLNSQVSCNWPCFHGPDRTNKSPETGLLKKWPDEGPELIWSVSGLGDGYSSVSLADNMIFTAGKENNQTYVFVYGMDGKLIWKKPNGKAWETTMSWATSYTGSRGTPTFDNGILYHLGETGRLAAFEARTGKEIWSQELTQLFNAEIPEYGYAESVLIDGDRLYCNPAGRKAYMICLDKRNGKLLWSNSEIPGAASYNSIVIMEFGGYRQVISMSSKFVFGINSIDGKLLWKIPFENSNELNCTDPVLFREYIFASSGYGKGNILIKLSSTGNDIKADLVWDTSLMDNHHGGLILHEGHIYGTGSNSRGLFCLDYLTGKQLWKADGKGSVTFAEGMLYLLEERGILKLIRINHEKYQLISEFRVPSGGKSMYWAHPVICNGRLYIRLADKLFLYNIKAL